MTTVDLRGYVSEKPPAVVVDTNVLLLLFVGNVSPRFIKKFPRTRQYSEEDYQMLSEILGAFRRLVTTPNVLSEVSNLAGQAGEPLRTQLFELMAAVFSEFTEEYVPSSDAVETEAFFRLGLTDICVSTLETEERPELMVLTDDVGLYEQVSRNGGTAVNFTHLVAARWEG